MRFHWQNLDDGAVKKRWLYGRCWIGSYHRCLRIEWVLPSWDFCIGVGFNQGEDDNEITFHFGLLLFTLYFGLNAFRIPVGHSTSYKGETVFLHDGRKCSLSVGDGALWISPWVDPMGDTMKKRRWYHRTYCINPADIVLGRTKYTEEILEKGEVLIPMPEGCYQAQYEKHCCTWKRPRWPFKVQRLSWWFEIPEGIPHEGKGENSWDCGEDGLFGGGSDQPNLERAIGDIVGICLRDRQRYGGRHTHRELKPIVVLRERRT